MRFLKTLTLNRRAIYDDRLAITTIDSIVMNTPKNLLIPKGVESDRPGSPTNGMIRYNTDTNQFEGYQAGAWRQFRFKEATNIIFQTNLGVGDDTEVDFGPLTPDPFTYSAANGVTWDSAQIAQNILVINETIWQVPGAGKDYTIVQKPTGPGGASETYVRFAIPIALGRPVYVVHNIGQ
jgi:hypothetical protein